MHFQCLTIEMKALNVKHKWVYYPILQSVVLQLLQGYYSFYYSFFRHFLFVHIFVLILYLPIALIVSTATNICIDLLKYNNITAAVRMHSINLELITFTNKNISAI